MLECGSGSGGPRSGIAAPQCFDTRLAATPFAVRETLKRVLTALSPLDLDIEEQFAVEIVLAEVLNNIAEHAYPPSYPAGPIRLRIDLADNGLLMRVEDQGKPMPNGQAPIGLTEISDVPTPDLPEGGFGWFLIRDLARDVQYRRQNGCNRLEFRIALAPSQLT